MEDLRNNSKKRKGECRRMMEKEKLEVGNHLKEFKLTSITNTTIKSITQGN
jgi:hypothetical protein